MEWQGGGSNITPRTASTMNILFLDYHVSDMDYKSMMQWDPSHSYLTYQDLFGDKT